MSTAINSTSIDISKRLDMYARRAQIFEKSIAVKNEDSTEFDFTGYTGEMLVYRYANDNQPPIGVTVGLDTGVITLYAPANTLDLTRTNYIYFLTLSLAGEPRLWLNGKFIINDALWDGIIETEEIIIALDGEQITLEISAGTGGGGGTSGPAGGDLTGMYPNPTIAANAVTNGKFRQSAGLSVVGRAGNTLGDVADITGTDGQVLRASGTSLAFGSIDLSDINTIGNSFLGIDHGGTGLTSIGSDGRVLQVSEGALSYGAVDLSNPLSVTSTLPVTNGGTGLSSTGSNGTVLRVSGGLLAYGSIDLSLTATVGSSLLAVANGGTGLNAVGSNGTVLRVAAGSLSYGSIDLSNTATVGSSILGVDNGGTGVSSLATLGVTTFSMSTNKMLGRTSASTGAVEEITIASPLTFSATTLGIQDAGAAQSGVVSITAQTLAGDKTLTGSTIFSPSYVNSSGSNTYKAISVTSTINQTAAATSNIFGFDYSPTLTSVTGVTHYAFRATAGVVLLGHTTIADTGTRLQVRGIGNSNGTTVRFESLGATLNAIWFDDGTVRMLPSSAGMILGSTSANPTATTRVDIRGISSGTVLRLADNSNNLIATVSNTGVLSYTSLAPLSSIAGTWTATANSDYNLNFGGSFTGRASQNTDFIYGYRFQPTVTAGGSTTTQRLIGVDISPTLTGTTGGRNQAIRVIGNSFFGDSDTFASAIMTVNIASGTGVNTVFTTLSGGSTRFSIAGNGQTNCVATIGAIVGGSAALYTNSGSASTSSGTSVLVVAQLISPTWSVTGGTPDYYGIRYAPTISSGTGWRHRAFYHNAGFVQWDSILTPAQITADQNDYNPTGWTNGGAPNGASILRISSDASRNITSLQGGFSGRLAIIANVGTQNIVLKDDDGATGTDINRFELNADITIAANQGVSIFYDGVSNRWRALKI